MFGSRLRVKRFEDRVLAYESVPVETGKILFYGHSLFTRCSFITKAGVDNPRLVDEVRMKGYGFQIEMKYTAWRHGFRLPKV